MWAAHSQFGDDRKHNSAKKILLLPTFFELVIIVLQAFFIICKYLAWTCDRELQYYIPSNYVSLKSFHFALRFKGHFICGSLYLPLKSAVTRRWEPQTSWSLQQRCPRPARAPESHGQDLNSQSLLLMTRSIFTCQFSEDLRPPSHLDNRLLSVLVDTVRHWIVLLFFPLSHIETSAREELLETSISHVNLNRAKHILVICCLNISFI